MAAGSGSLPPETVTREALVERARELVPMLREEAAASERDRRLTERAHRALRDAGLYRLFQPARHGGYEIGLGALVDVCAELGRGCGSSAWIFTNLAGQGWINGMKDPRVQDEVWGDDPDTLIASSHQGREATVRRVDGGFVADGTWTFSSGVDFASWNNLQIFVPRDDGPAEHYFALIPRADFEIIDDWFATGLAGTGSKSVSVRDVFIPDYRAIAAAQMVGEPTPGSAVNPSPIYRLPMFGIGNKIFSAPAIGIALGGLEAIEEDLGARVSVGGLRLAEQPTVHIRIGEASAEIEAARVLLERDCAEAMDAAVADESATVEQRARWRRNNAFAGKLCVQALERLTALAGGRGLGSDSPFQRAWRDVHAATSQVAMSWDVQATFYGRHRFGLEISDPRAFPER